ncbi:MAG TPA: GNAT family N-acetyltransferase [Herpetosiphonaceae bacterium]
MITFRPATDDDFPAIWAIFQAIIAEGDTYVQDETFAAEQGRQMWLGPGVLTMIALDEGQVVGAYKILPNQTGRGAHVANGSYIVRAGLRGRGIGRQMVVDSLRAARAAGYRAIQFNFVVSTNRGAVKLYEDLGFRILATLPEAFRHPSQGYVDAYVMHRWLADQPAGDPTSSGSGQA